MTKMSRKNEQERYQSVKEVLWTLKQLNTFKIDRYFNKIESNTIISKSVTFWQKLKLPISSAIGFFIIGVMSISLAQKLSPIENISPIPQLSLKNKAIQGILHFNSKIEPIKNTYYDVYLFNGRKDKQVKIEINSNEFDPALTLLNLDRQVLAINDDISPHNFNSQIIITLPEDGKYQIIVRASQPGETGNYQLKASVQS